VSELIVEICVMAAVASQSSWGPLTDLGLVAPPLDPNQLKSK